MHDSGHEENVLELTQLRRSFDNGRSFVVDGVSFSVARGRIVALVGINGAGKTTTVKMCGTLLAPTEGSVVVAGVDAVKNPEKARAHIGMVLGVERGFYPRASVRDNLRFFADLAAVSYREQAGEIARVLECVGLRDKENKKVQELSHGQKQRLHIARALLGSPELILLDEPTSGLDPDVAVTIRTLIRRVADQGAAILLTSHSMMEVSELADHIVVLNRGKVLVQGSERDIFNFAQLDQVLSFSLVPTHEHELEQLTRVLESCGLVSVTSQGAAWKVTVYLPDGVDKHALPSIEGAVLRPATLEDAFLALAEKTA
ncbi:MAG: ABC transporter ATP-binding protein [Corynebacterium sp.]|uniref:ABC transporter ATP-binding protein n=1 Tax=Corynebacterium sp. TaxID=1720 RepID=UPI0026DD23D1|nr:ABC transporter ATP-binding protein [Corynebacterium sp.]MDO4762475.1 ABC transporter ATP-binding protein [Corynebacterium sp.]